MPQPVTSTDREPQRHGFAFGRLLIGLAVLAVFLVALVPFVRRVLATANDTNAQTDLISIGKAQLALHDSTGAYAASLAQLTTLPPQLAAGESNGHRFRVVSSSTDAFLVQAAPTRPGITGYATCTINQLLTIHC